MNSKCAACGAPCPDMLICNTALCEAHFGEWLKLPRPMGYVSRQGRGAGAQAQMADLVAEVKARRGAA